jgi:hypothetical protein
MAEFDADLARLEKGLAPRARSVPPAPPARRRGTEVAAWVGGIAALAAAIAFVLPRLLGGDEPRAETAPAAEVAPIASPPPPAPKAVHVRVTSVPAGAEVWWESVKKGTTPMTMELPQRDDSIELAFRLDGYDDGKAIVYPTSDQEVTATLVAKPAPPPPPRRLPARPTARPARPEPDRGPTSGGEIKPSPFGK